MSLALKGAVGLLLVKPTERMQYLSISSPISCLLALAPLTALKVREAAAVEIMERLGLDLPYFKLAFQLLPLTVLLLG